MKKLWNENYKLWLFCLKIESIENINLILNSTSTMTFSLIDPNTHKNPKLNYHNFFLFYFVFFYFFKNGVFLYEVKFNENNQSNLFLIFWHFWHIDLHKKSVCFRLFCWDWTTCHDCLILSIEGLLIIQWLFDYTVNYYYYQK